MCLQRGDQFIQGAGGMADGVKRGHEVHRSE
jgi:hypothetical protein